MIMNGIVDRNRICPISDLQNILSFLSPQAIPHTKYQLNFLAETVPQDNHVLQIYPALMEDCAIFRAAQVMQFPEPPSKKLGHKK